MSTNLHGKRTTDPAERTALVLRTLAAGPLRFTGEELRLVLAILAYGPMSSRTASRLLRRSRAAAGKTAQGLVQCRILLRCPPPDGPLVLNLDVSDWRFPGTDPHRSGPRIDLRSLAVAQTQALVAIAPIRAGKSPVTQRDLVPLAYPAPVTRGVIQGDDRRPRVIDVADFEEEAQARGLAPAGLAGDDDLDDDEGEALDALGRQALEFTEGPGLPPGVTRERPR